MNLQEQIKGHARHIKEAEEALKNAQMSGDSQLRRDWYTLADIHAKLAIAYATRFH